ncbi:MAG: flagellar export protein FliJ [Desulfosporosinus sp.]|nr:flagellar export protein FliJ [Desulfosporosinus sp.]
MARFLFRLEASLRLAEQVLETAQRKYAQEIQHWQACVKAYTLQEERLFEAQEGQRDAGRQRPEELGNWQLFALDQQLQLRQCEAEQQEQEGIMELARHDLGEAHREVEKFRRLKEKQVKAFLWAELQKEQKILDETGQILHWRQQNRSRQT